MKKTSKRRRYFIKKEYQGKLVLKCFLFVAGIALFSNVILALLSTNSLTISYSDQDLLLGQTPMMLFKQLLTANWILVVFGGGFVVVASLVLSHRLVGPIHRFETTLDSMQNGKLDIVITLRKKDQGKDLAQKINDFNSQLSETIGDIHENSQALEEVIEQLRALDLPEEEKEQVAAFCSTMQEHTQKISTRCNFFTIKT